MKILDLLLRAATLPFGGRRPDTHAPGRKTSLRPRAAIVAAGSVAVLVGLALVVYGANQMLASESESSPRINILFSREVGTAIYDRPVRPTPPPTPAPSPVPTQAPPVVQAAPPPLRDRPYRIKMPKIGIDAQVVTYGLDANEVPEVPYNGWEVAWYNFSATPGTGGNAVFAGHVTWNGQAVFYNLDAMAPGDEIYLEGTDGTRVSYKVSEVFLVDANDANALRVMDQTPTDTMTVITCGGDFFYVGGVAQYDYTHRLIVRAALTGVQGGPAAGG